MADPIDFYFDFGSPYGYLASLRVDDVAAKHGREVTWRPMLLGAVFKTEGTQPLSRYPMKGPYFKHDCFRTARRLDVPFMLPDNFPPNTIAAQRAYYWLRDKDAGKAKAFARAVYRACFGEGRDVTQADVVAGIAVAAGDVDAGEAAAAVQDQAVKNMLRKATENAIARGVFGSPFIVVDGESFWGNDRLDEVDAWLETGGWESSPAPSMSTSTADGEKWTVRSPVFPLTMRTSALSRSTLFQRWSMISVLRQPVSIRRRLVVIALADT